MHALQDIFVGKWSYRSYLNDPDLATEPNKLLFGKGTIEIVSAPPQYLEGTIGGPGWQLDLVGSRSYGNPMEIRFEGSGEVDGAPWIYAYVGWLVPAWPNGVDQRPAMVGSIVRVIPHPSTDANGNPIVAPAGVTASWIAVRQ
ncbi:MAG TPA: hypothetical protein VJ724_08035 [Tahibacter sp.]|nr:hypothetical protein [Tahibacter sp.]